MIPNPDRSQKVDAVGADRHHLVLAVFLGCHRGNHVNPGHNGAPESNADVVGMLGHDEITGLNPALGGSFWFKGDGFHQRRKYVRERRKAKGPEGLV